jgi:hypothetical protein
LILAGGSAALLDRLASRKALSGQAAARDSLAIAERLADRRPQRPS